MRRKKPDGLVSLTIKDIRRTVVTMLHRMAGAQNRSLNREVIHILERAARESAAIQDETRHQVDAWRQLAGRWVGEGTAVEEARAMMNRRSGNRKIPS